MLKRLAEWYLGVPPAGPGEATQWEWRLSSSLPAGLTIWAAVCLAIAAVGVVTFLYFREAPRLSRTRRAALVGLRVTSLALLVLLSTGPVLRIHRTGLPPLVVLVDDSASMRLEDAYQGEELATVRRWLDDRQIQVPSRAQLARRLLTSTDANLIAELSRRYTIRLYRFAEVCEPLVPFKEHDGQRPEVLVDAIDALRADGPETRLGEAINSALNDARGITPAAVILLSDGIATPGSEVPLHTATQAAAERGVPLFTVLLGSDRRARDLELVDLQVDELAFVGDPLQITGHVRSAGFEGRRVPLRITVRDIRGDDTRLSQIRTIDVRIRSDEGLTRFESNHVFPSPGRYELLVEVEGKPGEADLTNNEDVRHVTVLDRKIRVLIVDSVPRWEFRYLKHVLERQPTVEVNTLLLEADLGYAAEDRTALTHFPVIQEDLLAYDVIVWGDIDATRFTPQLLTNVRDLVSRTGGGLLIIAGTRDTPQSLAGTPLEQLLPVELDSLQSDDSVKAAEGFAVSLTPQGAEGIPIFRGADAAGDNIEFWKRGPQLRWMLPFHRLKPGAVPLLQRSDSVPPVPVISLQRFGAGQVLFHATDELWLWRSLAGGRYYARYWVQAIRYLSRARLLSSHSGWELSSNRRSYAPGEPVQLIASRQTIGADDRPPERVSISFEGPGGSRRSIELERIPGKTQWASELQPQEPGRYRAVLDGHDVASTTFRVDDTPAEFLERHARRSELASAAGQTGGRSYTIADAHRLPQHLPRGSAIPLNAQTRVPLWSRPEALLLFVLVLSAEWVLRKRNRLL